MDITIKSLLDELKNDNENLSNATLLIKDFIKEYAYWGINWEMFKTMLIDFLEKYIVSKNLSSY